MKEIAPNGSLAKFAAMRGPQPIGRRAADGLRLARDMG
jgi:hypothetical protein